MSTDTVVVDGNSRDALFALASQEGILHSKGATDGVYERIVARPVDYRIREQLLEQVVLTPNVAIGKCHDFLWDALGGVLVENGALTRAAASTDAIPAEAECLSLDIISGLVRAAGHDIPIADFGPRCLRCNTPW